MWWYSDTLEKRDNGVELGVDEVGEGEDERLETAKERDQRWAYGRNKIGRDLLAKS